MKIVALGLGAWGVAVSNILAINGYKILGYSRNKAEVDMINLCSKISKFPTILLHKNLKATANINDIIDGDLVIIGLPSKAIASFFQENYSLLSQMRSKNFILLTKGFNEELVVPYSDYFQDKLGISNSQICILSGPSFALQVLELKTTIVSLASVNQDLLEKIQKIFENSFFKVSLTNDIRGIQLMGLVKNVIAIGMGILDGLSCKENEKAYLMSQFISELVVLNDAIGGKSETIFQPAGFGDIFLSSIGSSSRNFKFGKTFAENYPNFTLPSETVEGLVSLGIVNNLCKHKNLPLKTFQNLYKIIFQGENIINLLS